MSGFCSAAPEAVALYHPVILEAAQPDWPAAAYFEAQPAADLIFLQVAGLRAGIPQENHPVLFADQLQAVLPLGHR